MFFNQRANDKIPGSGKVLFAFISQILPVEGQNFENVDASSKKNTLSSSGLRTEKVIFAKKCELVLHNTDLNFMTMFCLKMFIVMRLHTSKLQFCRVKSIKYLPKFKVYFKNLNFLEILYLRQLANSSKKFHLYSTLAVSCLVLKKVRPGCPISINWM
jgi:hypothetical protein